jgi:hypothetical protein
MNRSFPRSSIPGMDGLVWFGLGVRWFEMVWVGSFLLVWLVLGWCGLVWVGMGWFGSVWVDLVSSGWIWLVWVGMDCGVCWFRFHWIVCSLGGFGLVWALIFCRAQTENALQNVWLNSSCFIVFHV